MKIIYKTRATASGGRSGRSQLDDGSLGFDLAMPGSGKVGANPEQLFAIGYAACFDSAGSWPSRARIASACHNTHQIGRARVAATQRV